MLQLMRIQGNSNIVRLLHVRLDEFITSNGWRDGVGGGVGGAPPHDMPASRCAKVSVRESVRYVLHPCFAYLSRTRTI